MYWQYSIILTIIYTVNFLHYPFNIYSEYKSFWNGENFSSSRQFLIHEGQSNEVWGVSCLRWSTFAFDDDVRPVLYWSSFHTRFTKEPRGITLVLQVRNKGLPSKTAEFCWYIKFSKEIRATASKGFMFLFICPNKRREAVSLGSSCSGSKTFELIFCVMFEFWCRPPLAWMYYVYFGRKLNVALRDDHFTVNQKLSNRQKSFRTTIHAPFPSSLQTKKNLVILRFYDRRLWFTFSVSKKRAIFF